MFVLQVVAAAALRLQQEKLAHAAQEAATLSLQAARISALNQQAQASAQRKRAQKQQVAVSVTFRQLHETGIVLDPSEGLWKQQDVGAGCGPYCPMSSVVGSAGRSDAADA